MEDSLSGIIRTGVQDVNKTIGNEYAFVTRVNSDKTINVHLEASDKDSDDLFNVPLAVDFDLKKDDKVILTYLDNKPENPVIIGMINPQFNGTGENGRSIVSIDKVETDGLVDVYRITYDKAPIYSYFSVKNGTIGEQGPKGDNGDTGSPGSKGDKGDQGPAGEQGISGVPSELAGKTVRLPVLVDTKTVTNQSSIVFSGLNGDVDNEYKLEFVTDFDTNGSSRYLNIAMNNATISIKGWNEYTTTLSYMSNDIGNTAGVNANKTGGIDGFIELKELNRTQNARFNGSFLITRVSGTDIPASYGGGIFGSLVDNVTSITLSTTAGTFSGTIKLYKIVDVTYPTN